MERLVYTNYHVQLKIIFSLASAGFLTDKGGQSMTAINTFRPHLGRAAMLLVSAAALLLVAAPKAGAWSETTDDGLFTVANRSGYSSIPVTVTSYNGSDTNITFPDKITVSGIEYPIVSIGSNVLTKLAEVDDITVNVTIPDSYTTLDSNAFKNCYGLKSITVPGSVTKIQYNAFEGCKNLSSVTFADGSSNLSFGNKVFLNCTSLNNLTLPARLSDLDAGVFQGCTSLTDLTTSADNASYLIQDGIVYAKNDDSDSYTLHSYLSSNSASSLTVPSEVNGKPVTAIFRLAFQNNAKLQSVTIPASVTNFQSSCFDGCSSLKKVSIAAENPTIASYAFTDLAADSVIEVANDSVVSKFTSSTYTSSKTTVKVKSNAPEPEAAPAASLTVKGTGVKDGYSYYKVTLDNPANITTMIVNLSFDASQISMKALADGKKDAYAKLNDSRFVLTPNWKEENGKVKVSLLLTTGNNAVTSEDSSTLLLLALPVKANITGNIAMTVDSAECGGVVSGNSIKNTVTVNGSASNRITSYDVNADDTIDILVITEAQRFYQADSSDSDWADAQKADVNGDGKIDIQDLIDIFLQIKF